MPRDALPSNNEKAFVLTALQQNTRLDSRPFDAYRPISLAFPGAYGQTDVRTGKTRVLCNITCEVITPYQDRKFDGVFTISCELSPLADPGFEVGRYEVAMGPRQ